MTCGGGDESSGAPPAPIRRFEPDADVRGDSVRHMTGSHLEEIRGYDPTYHAPGSVAATKGTCTWHTDVEGTKPLAVKSLLFVYASGSHREAVCQACFDQMTRDYPVLD